jgi:hypothetical protein
VIVNDVTADGPAAKAGLKAGDRIQSVNGVNLKLDRSDVNDESLEGIMQRRLQREMAKAKPGDDIALRVLSGSAVRNVTVKAVAQRELTSNTLTRTGQSWTWNSGSPAKDRAALGVQLGGSPSKRDTLGVLVIAVNGDGPAEKAGIIEGDRIARINGVDLRVPGVDAGDTELAQARVSRLQNELGKLDPGAVATLTVVTAGRSREVRVTTIKSSELGGTATYFFNDGSLRALQELPRLMEQTLPLIRGRVEGHPLEVRKRDGQQIEVRKLDGQQIELRRKVEGMQLEAVRKAEGMQLESLRKVEGVQREAQATLKRAQEVQLRALQSSQRELQATQLRQQEATKRAEETLQRARVVPGRRVIVL